MTEPERIHLDFPDLPCSQFVELVTEYLDDALSGEERARVDEHLGICEACATVLAQWRLMIELTGELRSDDVDAVDPATRQSLMEAFRQARRST